MNSLLIALTLANALAFAKDPQASEFKWAQARFLIVSPTLQKSSLTPFSFSSLPATSSFESSSGARRTLKELRGRVVVLFYEAREHTNDNRVLKDTLERFVRDNRLEKRLVLLPMADVEAYNFTPANHFARTAIRSVAKQIRREIWIDWHGQLKKPPFGFVGEQSHIAVLNAKGELTFRSSGVITAAQRSELFKTIRHALRTNH